MARRQCAADTIVDFPITVENYIDSYNSTTVYNTFAGSGGSMKLVVNGSNTTPAKAYSVTRGLIQLPTAATSIPAADVIDATIYLDLTQDTGANPYDSAEAVNLYPLTQSFNPTTATWNTTGGGVFESTGVAWNPGPSSSGALQDASKANPVLCSWDVTSLWSDSNLLTNGAIFKYNEPAAEADLPPGSNPYMTVTLWGGSPSSTYPLCQQAYVAIDVAPEPSTLALLAAGAILAAIGYGWRRTARRERRWRTRFVTAATTSFKTGTAQGRRPLHARS